MPYIGKAPSSGIRSRFIYTATASQTTFTGADGNGKTLGYTDGEYVDVYLNGVLLDPADYTATSKTSVVLDSGAAASDIVEIVVYDTFSVFNGTFTGDLTVDGDTLFVDASADAVGINTTSDLHAGLTVLDTNYTTSSLGRTGLHMRGSASADGNYTAAVSFTNEFRDGHSAIAGVAENADNDVMGLAFFTHSSTGGTNPTAERMRVDSSGNLLVGKTTTAFGTAGIRAIYNGQLQATATSNEPLGLNRLSTDGAMADFYKDSSKVGTIGSIAGHIFIADTNTGLKFDDGFDAIVPCSATANRDNAIDWGAASVRFDDIYATNGTIQTSDANEKQQIASLTDAEITAAKAISKLFKTFKWNDKVEAKGDAARTHAGVIAQDVQQAMTDAGLDAGDYAFFISATWWEQDVEVPAVEAVEAQDAVLDDDGNIVTEAVEAVEAQDAYTRTDTYDTADEAPEGATERTRLGIRYPELLAFIGAATEQRLTHLETLEARIEALENA